MYDFNPLATLFLIKALPTDIRLPSLRKLTFRRPAARRAKEKRATRAVANPSYNLNHPARSTPTTPAA